MVLYTPLSYHEMFPEQMEGYKYVTYQGRTLYVKETEHGELQLVQLMSTDPQDYLNTSLTPGTILKNEFVQQRK